MQIACGRVTAQVKQQFSRVPVKEVEYGWRRSAHQQKKKEKKGSATQTRLSLLNINYNN